MSKVLKEKYIIESKKEDKFLDDSWESRGNEKMVRIEDEFEARAKSGWGARAAVDARRVVGGGNKQPCR